MSECGRGTLQAHGILGHGTRAMTSRRPPPRSTHTSCCRLQLQSLHPINSYASQLADRPSAPACPPPVGSQRYQDVIHTLFILRADDIHTVRGCGRACGHASSCVAALTREWPVLLQFLSVACSLMLCAKCAYTDRQSGERLLTDNRILFSLLVPQPKSWGDLSHPVPMVVAPMLNLLTCKWVRNIHINGWWITICICIWLDTAPHIHTGTSRPHIGQTDKHTRDCDSNYYLQRYIIDTTLYCGNSRQIHQSRRSTATVSEITIHNINSITRCQSTQIKYKPTRLHHSLSVTSHLVSKQLETNIIHGKNRATLNYYWNMGKISQNRQQQLLVTLMYMKHCYENKIYNYMKAYRTIKEDQKM